MRTVVLVPPSPDIEDLIARRHALGLDTHDEVWEGDYHMAPAAHAWHGLVDQQLAVLLDPLLRSAGLVGGGPFNLGGPGDFRVPDRGAFSAAPSGVWVPTAALVVEIESPEDETWDKLPFYAAHRVEEVLVVSPYRREVVWLRLAVSPAAGTLAGETGGYMRVERSGLLGVEAAGFAEAIEWPGAGCRRRPAAATSW